MNEDVTIYVIAWIIFGLISWAIARARGIKESGWFVIGMVLGPIGVIWALVKKPSG